MTFHMTAELQASLINGIQGEGWDEDGKDGLYETILKMEEGDEIAVPSDDAEIDGIEYETAYPVWSLVEYFGVNHLVETR